jgi:two-component system cell cycle sensor histidine kinase/response regulator CckA
MSTMSLRIAPVMLHSIDWNGVIVEVSELWLAKLGYTSDEVIGRRSVEFLTEESARYATEVVLPAFFKNGACEVEYEMLRKDRTTLPVRLHGVAVRNDDGAFVRSIAVIEDLTERRALERKMFEIQKVESLGLMAGNIAHDFSNLLGSVIGSLQTATRHAGHLPGAASALDHAQLAASRAADLCQQLLAYSGRGRFEVVTIEVDALLAELANVLEIPVGARARLALELAHEGACATVDATQIRQVLMNLVLNAADAMGEVPGTITIRSERVDLDVDTIARSLRPEAAPGAYVAISVLDDGCGMTPDVQARVFEPFFTTKPTGRGLGLAATLGIIRGHHGTITVATEIGRGTCFTVLLPLATRTPHRVTPPSSADSHRGTVLVVDDDELLSSTIARQLGEAGFRTLVARSGREALALLGDASIKTCVIDVSMPDMTGPQLAAQIARVTPSADIVLMSGFDRVDVGATAHTRFLRKPFSEDELLAVIAAGAERV